MDMSLATGFALLEAAEQGLDTCIICAFREDAVKDLLHVPASARVVSMVALGYGGQQPPEDKKEYGRNRQL